MDIQKTEKIDEKTADIGNYMESDPDIADYALFVSKIFPVKLDNGEAENFKVELGEHLVFRLQYAEGRLPAEEHEIARLISRFAFGSVQKPGGLCISTAHLVKKP